MPAPMLSSPTFWITSAVRAPPSRAPQEIASASSSWVARTSEIHGASSILTKNSPSQPSGTVTATVKPMRSSVSRISDGRCTALIPLQDNRPGMSSSDRARRAGREIACWRELGGTRLQPLQERPAGTGHWEEIQ